MEISTASQQQATGLNQISKAMSQLDQVAQSNAASAEEAAASSEEMSGQTTALKEQVNELTMIIEGHNGFSGNQQVNSYQNKVLKKNKPGSHVARNISQNRFKSSIKNDRDSEKVIPFKNGNDLSAEFGKVGSTEGF